MSTRQPPRSEDDQLRQALIAAAQAGDADAQCRMGDLCRTGDQFTPQDYAEALRWYRLAAERGDPNAKNNIGAMHEHAMGVPEDMAEAAKWYRLSADQGFAIAQYNLALLLGWGRGVPMDEPEATALLHKAASQGHVGACTILGTLYRFGDGVEKRIPQAAEFHVTAALEGDKEAINSLADYREGIEQEALNGRMLAALCLSKMYDRGLGVEASKAVMYSWLLWGHKHGNRNEDPDVADELDDMREFYALVMSVAERNEATQMVKRMSAIAKGNEGTKAMPREPSKESKPKKRQAKKNTSPAKPAKEDHKPSKTPVMPISEKTEEGHGTGFILGGGKHTQPANPTTSTPPPQTGIEVTVVEFKGHLTVLKTDHDKKRLGVWALIDGKWVPGDMDAFYEGKMLHGTPVPTSPPLPAWD